MNIAFTRYEHDLALEYLQYGIEGQRLIMAQPALMIGTSDERLDEMRTRNRAAQKLLEDLEELRG